MASGLLPPFVALFPQLRREPVKPQDALAEFGQLESLAYGRLGSRRRAVGLKGH